LNKQVYYRLVALWALSEGVLGGIIHGFNLPISGLIVGSAAVIIICMIGYYAPEKSAIIKATILVCIFKLILSPQSPLPAYVAVLFQGFTGSLFFWNKKFFKTFCLLFAVLALIESAVQKVLVTTILFGMNFWKAVNDFINGLTHQQTIMNYSLYFVSIYILLHLIAGIVVGRFAGKLPEQLKRADKFSVTPFNMESFPIQRKTSGRSKKIRTGLLIVWMVLLLLFLQSQFHIGQPLLSSNLSLQIFIRSVLIILAWYFVVSPLIMLLMKRWLDKQKEKSRSDIRAILELLPSTRMLLEKCWHLSATRSGLKRLNEFCKMVLVNSLNGGNE
jgi:uncharacterized membrane protein YhaH (DUF805 family)